MASCTIVGSMFRRKISLILFTLAFLLPFTQSALATVIRTDECTLGQKLGVPVYAWQDKTVSDKALIVAFHGMTFYGLAFNDMATYLASQGYPVYAFDFHG